MKHTLMKAGVATALALAIPFGGISAAHAAPGPEISAASVNLFMLPSAVAKKVSIKKIADKTVSIETGTVKVVPQYSKPKDTRITSATVTVKNSSGKTIVGQKNSANLKAGTYRVTTKVRYSYKSGSATVNNSASMTQTLHVAPQAIAKKIPNKKASAYGKSVTVKPNYDVTKGATVTSARITVKNSAGKTLASKVQSASLKAGTYKVATTVKYSYEQGSAVTVKSTSIKQTLKITQPAKSGSMPITGGYSAAVIRKEAIAIFNDKRAGKGLSRLKISSSLDSANSAWVRGNFKKEIPFADEMLALASAQVKFGGDRNAKGLVSYLESRPWWAAFIYDASYTHVSVIVDNSGSLQKIGIAFAKY